MNLSAVHVSYVSTQLCDKRKKFTNIIGMNYHLNQSGAAEAWWAHNPQVPGSKPGSDKFGWGLITFFVNLTRSVTEHNRHTVTHLLLQFASYMQLQKLGGSVS